MKFSFSVCMSIVLAAHLAFAQAPAKAPAEDDPTKSKWTEEKIENPPAREIKFERIDTPLESRLTRPDPKLFEQKFAARFRMTLPELRRSDLPRYRSELRDVGISDRLGDELILNPQQSRGFSEGRSTQKDVERLLKLMPEKLRLDAEKLEFLYSERGTFNTWGQTNNASINGFASGLAGGRDREAAKNYREFQILAPTAEVAEERVKALLLLLDQGMFRPMQLAAWKSRASEVEAYTAGKQRVDDLESELVKLKAQTAEYADFTADMLPGIRLQQTQLDINLADVKARVAACEKLLEKGNTKEVQQRIEETKIACAIELAGLEAGRAKSEDLMQKVKASIELGSKYDRTANTFSGVRQSLQQHQRNLISLERDLDDFAPRPLVDGKVTIMPLVWTQ